MVKTTQKIVIQAIVITAVSAAIGVTTNLMRSDGIPLVTDIPYEIFAPCKDSEATSEIVTADKLALEDGEKTLYVDARPSGMFELEHVDGAINVPYSALFGASEEDMAKIAKAVQDRGVTSVIVYGAYADPASPETKVDFGKPLAQQLIEAGIEGVRHVPDGLKSMNKTGIKTVKKDRGTK
ncbi:MAG: rhodanese-like domain-containing protein [Proteobacteria bacterium]|nr:rhodanese-like domain-containing protein [Pseudomonadota bacterium]